MNDIFYRAIRAAQKFENRNKTKLLRRIDCLQKEKPSKRKQVDLNLVGLVFELHDKGIRRCDIATQLGVSPSYVTNSLKRFKREGETIVRIARKHGY